MRRNVALSDALCAYIDTVGVREHPVLARCRAETAKLGPVSMMQIAPVQGAFMGLMARLTGARRALELGVFTGYSALSVALAMPDDGRITACDVSAEWTALAKGYWKDAGVADKIDLKLGPAVETLKALHAAGEDGSFDLAFIDADKDNYDTYYEDALALLRPGGLVMLDNMLWSGQVADPAASDRSTEAIRALNAKIHADSRVDMLLLPLGDGVMLACKRG